jgi:small subunit ribosomal protein S1
VLDVDLDRERVSLSLKATQEDPWRQFARSHEVDDILEGRVTKLVPFGAFVEVDDAIEGLVHISELAEHHVERSEDEVRVHDRIPVKIIDIDLDRRRISLSRKQALRAEAASPELAEAGAISDATGGEPSEEEAEMELETREASENIGVPTEDPENIPESDAEILSAAEASPEIAGEALAPEVAESPIDAAAAAPPEEAEEAEAIAEMSPDSPPEGREHLTASDPDHDNLETSLLREEPDEGAAPGESIDALTEPRVEAEGEAATGDDEESLEPSDQVGDDSIESIVADLKRERGQN